MVLAGATGRGRGHAEHTQLACRPGAGPASPAAVTEACSLPHRVPALSAQGRNSRLNSSRSAPFCLNSPARGVQGRAQLACTRQLLLKRKSLLATLRHGACDARRAGSKGAGPGRAAWRRRRRAPATTARPVMGIPVCRNSTAFRAACGQAGRRGGAAVAALGRRLGRSCAKGLTGHRPAAQLLGERAAAGWLYMRARTHPLPLCLELQLGPTAAIAGHPPCPTPTSPKTLVWQPKSTCQ